MRTERYTMADLPELVTRACRLILAGLFILLFLVCFSPYSLFRILTETESVSARKAFWDARMQSMALFIGVGLAAGALRILATRRVDPNAQQIHPLSDLEEQEIRRNNTWYRFQIPATFVLTGGRAVRYGLTMFAFGCICLAFGLHFWIGTFIPQLKEANRTANQALHGTAGSRADASPSVP